MRLSGSIVYAVDVMLQVIGTDRRRSTLVLLRSRSGGAGDVNVSVDNSDKYAGRRQYQYNDELDWQQRSTTTHVVSATRGHVAAVKLGIIGSIQW